MFGSAVRVVGLTEAIFDTGTTQILGDPDGIERFYAPLKRFGAKPAPQYGDGIYTSTRLVVSQIRRFRTFDLSITVPCDFSTPISVYFRGTEIKISPDSFTLDQVEGTDTCIAGAASNAALEGIKLAPDNYRGDKADLHRILGSRRCFPAECLQCLGCW